MFCGCGRRKKKKKGKKDDAPIQVIVFLNACSTLCRLGAEWKGGGV